MSETASGVETKPDSTHNSGNANQPSVAQLDIATGSSPMASHLTHNRDMFGERSDTMDPPNLSPYQEWVPAENELYQSDEQYNSDPWLPNFSEEALSNSAQPTGSPENIYWTEPSFARDLLDGSLMPAKSSPREATDGTPLYDCDEKSPAISDGKKAHDEAVEDRGSKRRKRSISADQQAADIEERRRVRRVIRYLEHFENEQRLYGKQQLKAIEDGFV